MEARLDLEIHRSAPAGWDDDLRASRGVVFHSEGWAAYKLEESGGDPAYCLWCEPGGDVVGRALAIRRPGSDSLAARLGTRLVFDSPPVCDSDRFDFVAPLVDWAAATAGVIEVSLGSYDERSLWSAAELPNARSRMEFVLPPGDADSVWTEMRTLARRKVKKARKIGFESSLATEVKDLRAFADVYAVTVTRLEDTKGVDAGSGIDSQAFASALSVLADGDVGCVYTAGREGRVEAGVVFATFGERAYMIHSGASDSGREEGAPFLVLHDALVDLHGRGFSEINLGGAGGDAADPESSEHGLHQFKTRFGAAVESRTSGALHPRPTRARVTGAVRRLVRR
jgi:hypothetical protein